MKVEFNEQVLLKGLANNDSKAIETIYKENFKGKLIELPLYLDSNFKGNKIKFELR